jgi:hypothetical protein
MHTDYHRTKRNVSAILLAIGALGNALLTAAHCSLQRTAHCSTLLTARTAHCSTLLTAAHCSLQHTAHCSTLYTHHSLHFTPRTLHSPHFIRTTLFTHHTLQRASSSPPLYACSPTLRQWPPPPRRISSTRVAVEVLLIDCAINRLCYK